jgi:hypothetical protein
MKAHAARRGRPPDVDEGDARDLVALLRRELRLTPGRLGDCVRIVVVVLAVVAILETFRIPEIAVSAYLILFLSGREAASTVRRRWSRASPSCWRFSRRSPSLCSACPSRRSVFR